jgi:hypothetical protein
MTFREKDFETDHQEVQDPETSRELPESALQQIYVRNVKRHDVWFRDHNGNPWHGVNLDGGYNQIVRCRRVKETPGFPMKKATNS